MASELAASSLNNAVISPCFSLALSSMGFCFVVKKMALSNPRLKSYLLAVSVERGIFLRAPV